MRRPEIGILCDVEPIKIGGARIVCGACGDGYRVHDTIERLVHYLNDHPEAPNGVCPHTVLFNGGALNASPEFNPDRPQTRDEFIYQISESLEVQQTPIVLLHAHAPCAKARKRNLDFVAILHHLFLAKMEVKTRLAGQASKVLVFCHVDYFGHGKGKQVTYQVCRQAWEKWRDHSEFKTLAQCVSLEPTT